MAIALHKTQLVIEERSPILVPGGKPNIDPASSSGVIEGRDLGQPIAEPDLEDIEFILIAVGIANVEVGDLPRQDVHVLLHLLQGRPP